jgi:ADP-ribose pyrophosphatase
MSHPPVKPWTVESRTLVDDHRIFRLHRDRARSTARPEQAGDFVVLAVPDWVNVVALTPDEQVVVIEQYRHGTRSITLEIPGGMVDPGETMVAAGLRELAEETGYAGDSVELIGVVEPNPAFQDNARPVGAQDLDPNEEIAVRLVPLADIPGLIRSGAITHALVVAAFHHLTLHAAQSTSVG